MIALYLNPCVHGHSPRSWPTTSRRHAEQSEDFGFGAEEERTLLTANGAIEIGGQLRGTKR